MIIKECKTISDFCEKYLSSCDVENYVFIAVEALKFNSKPKEEIAHKILNHLDFKSLRKFIEGFIKSLNNYDFENFMEKLCETELLMIDNGILRDIKKDEKLHLFFLNYISDYTSFYKKGFIFNQYIFLTFLINIILIRKLNRRDELEIEIEDIKKKYIDAAKCKINLNKYISDPIFFDWSENYLDNMKSMKSNFHYYVAHPRNTSLDLNSKESKLMGYLYYIHAVDENSYIVLINLMKNAWQQKKYRDKGNIKKKYHLPLTLEAKDQLEKISELKNISENKVLEELIRKAYLKEICDENGKPRY